MTNTIDKQHLTSERTPMTDIIDLHTHTVASMHAYSTIREMAAAAKEKGLALLGI